jgi:ubiquitin-conjugating enzyme E2 Q
MWADDSAPSEAASKLGNLGLQTGNGRTVSELLHMVSVAFDCHNDDIDMQDAEDEDDDSDGIDYYDDEDFGFNDNVTIEKFALVNRPPREIEESTARMRQDLIATKQAGFKVGFDGSNTSGSTCHISVSIRVSKLGISQEAMQTWHIKPDDYLILVMAHSGGYRSLEELLKNISLSKNDISFKTGLSKTYKPTREELLDMFNPTTTQKNNNTAKSQAIDENTEQQGWRDTFISRSLNQLFSHRFLLILQSRIRGLGWAGAEQFVHACQASLQDEKLDEVYNECLEMHDEHALYPYVVTADHIETSSPESQLSTPLIAMQFLLRHFVRCTEFCLVCHQTLDNKLQAIKPYVCDRPLCLYQYMSLGFGPSIEHEILTQPLVVDLLISFCWKAAASFRLKSFPTGMNLIIPNPFLRAKHVAYSVHASPLKDNENEPHLLVGSHAINADEVTFAERNHNIVPGEWIMMRLMTASNPTPEDCWEHRRVLSVFGPTITISSRGLRTNEAHFVQESQSQNNVENVEIIRYSHNFDDLDDQEKLQAMISLMNLLPSVDEMKQWLLSHSTSSLAEWKNRIPLAAYGVLRWIIASNRACIMQVESSDRMTGLSDEWVQFRFAMGAPVSP